MMEAGCKSGFFVGDLILPNERLQTMKYLLK